MRKCNIVEIVTEGELLAFFLSGEISKRFIGNSLEISLHSAIKKISKTAKGPVTVDVEALHTHYTYSGPVSTVSNKQALLDIHHAKGGSPKWQITTKEAIRPPSCILIMM
jgi:hypothetical protein